MSCPIPHLLSLKLDTLQPSLTLWLVLVDWSVGIINRELMKTGYGWIFAFIITWVFLVVFSCPKSLREEIPYPSQSGTPIGHFFLGPSILGWVLSSVFLKGLLIFRRPHGLAESLDPKHLGWTSLTPMVSWYPDTLKSKTSCQWTYEEISGLCNLHKTSRPDLVLTFHT